MMKDLMFRVVIAVSILFLSSCQNSEVTVKPSEEPVKTESNNESESLPQPKTADSGKREIATLGGGCFWCVEAPLEAIDGIYDVRSGYMGGTTENPTYKEVCNPRTNAGHIEVVEISFDPEQISFDLVLEAFWLIHDPTTKDRQGADIGVQYRSAIFYHDEVQKLAAENSIAKLNESGKWKNPVVTEVRPIETFWEAEDYHQDYFANNPNQGYCNAKIPPKLIKLFSDAKFKDRRKKG